jgi:hypothetical protein
MDESFSIPVIYKGIDMEFEAHLRVFGYSHRFLVSIEGADVFFERDEEGHYRAVIPPEHHGKIPSTALLQHIAQAIEEILS